MPPDKLHSNHEASDDDSDASSVASSLDRINFNDIMEQRTFKNPVIASPRINNVHNNINSSNGYPPQQPSPAYQAHHLNPSSAGGGAGADMNNPSFYNNADPATSTDHLYRPLTNDSYQSGNLSANSNKASDSKIPGSGAPPVISSTPSALNTHSNIKHQDTAYTTNSGGVLLDKSPRDWKSWYFYHQPKNFYRKLFIFVSLLSATVILALQIYIFALYFVHLDSNSDTTIKKKAIATYLALFICAEIYQCIITISAVRSKSRIQVFLLLTFYGCMVIYSGIQLVELKHSLSPSLPENYRSSPQGAIIAIICLLMATFVAQAYLFLIHLRKDFAWNVFKKIGAAPEALKRLSIFQYYRALLYFDGFFFPAFTLQFVIMMPKVETVEFVLTIIVIPVSMLLLVFADFSAATELLYGSLVCFAAYCLGLVYAFFKVIRIYTHNTDPHMYYPGRRSLTVFAVFSVILLFMTACFCLMVTRNFNRGLKPIVSKAWTNFLIKIRLLDPNTPGAGAGSSVIDINNTIGRKKKSGSRQHRRGHSSGQQAGIALTANQSGDSRYNYNYKQGSDGKFEEVQLQDSVSHNYENYNHKPQAVPAIIVD